MIRDIPLSELSVVWAGTQRRLDRKRAQSIADKFNPDFLGVIIVTDVNNDGMHHVIDGQHRVCAANIVFPPDHRLVCNVIGYSDPVKAAEIFDAINTGRKAPKSIDVFKIRLVAGAEIETAVNTIARDVGYEIDDRPEPGYIRASGACVEVYNRYGADCLLATLRIIKDAWGFDKGAVSVNVIKGMARFLNDFGDQIDRASLVNKLSKRFTGAQLLAAGKSAKQYLRCSSADAVTSVIKQEYNNGRRTRRLEG